MEGEQLRLADPKLERLRDDERREVARLLAALIREAIALKRSGTIRRSPSSSARFADDLPPGLESNGKPRAHEGAGERT